jgi:hypothetical protein
MPRTRRDLKLSAPTLTLATTAPKRQRRPKISPAPIAAPTPQSPSIASAPSLPAPSLPAPGTPDPKGNLGIIVALLRRPDGARIDELTAATGWQAHSVRGGIAGAIKKKLGLLVISQKTEAGRLYRIESLEPAA